MTKLSISTNSNSSSTNKIKKQTSLHNLKASVRGGWLKSFKSNGKVPTNSSASSIGGDRDSFDFGCKGDLETNDNYDSDTNEDYTHSYENNWHKHLPTLPSAPPNYRSNSVSSSKRASFDSKAEALQREEQIGIDACLTYMSRASSSSGSVNYNSPRLPSSFDVPSYSYSYKSTMDNRTRSNSTTSSYCSSRPLTNDSLPSYRTDNSNPPSPLLCNPYRRPSLAPSLPPLPAAMELPITPRTYTFI